MVDENVQAAGANSLQLCRLGGVASTLLMAVVVVMLGLVLGSGLGLGLVLLLVLPLVDRAQHLDNQVQETRFIKDVVVMCKGRCSLEKDFKTFWVDWLRRVSCLQSKQSCTKVVLEQVEGLRTSPSVSQQRSCKSCR